MRAQLREKYPNPALAEKQILAQARKFIEQAGRLSGVPRDANAETAELYWLIRLRSESPHFHAWVSGGGFINDVLQATIELLQHLSRTGALETPALPREAVFASPDAKADPSLLTSGELPKDAPAAVEHQTSTEEAAGQGAAQVSMPVGVDDQAAVAIRGVPRASSEPTSLEPYRPLTATEEMSERRRLRDDYKAEWRKAGVKVTDEMIAKSVRKQWRSRYQIQRWLRLHPRVQSSDQLIRKVLRDRPTSPS